MYLDTILYVRSLLRGASVAAAACGLAAVLGAGVPLAWVWVASQLSASPGQSVSGLAALAAIAGPPATYVAIIVLAGLIRAPSDGAARPPRMSWNHPPGEVRPRARPASGFEVVIVLATLLVVLAFEAWFFLFAHTQPWGAG